jgi:cAMP-dependent protein kinase regulator
MSARKSPRGPASPRTDSASNFLARITARRRDLESDEAAVEADGFDEVHALRSALLDTQSRLWRLEQLVGQTVARVDSLEREPGSEARSCSNCAARERELSATLREAEEVVRSLLNKPGARDPKLPRQSIPGAKKETRRVVINLPKGDKEEEERVEYPKGYDPRKRRMSVSAESPGSPSTFRATKVPKSAVVRAQIHDVISNNILFRHLDEAQLEECVDVMVKKEYAKGDIIIKQGDLVAQYFFILANGEVDVIVNGKQVAVLEVGRSFGEIALMYNTPRNATIQAKNEVVCWAMEGPAFRSMLMQYSMQQREKYESFLEAVPLLNSLTGWERGTIADALQAVEYDDGDIIIRQGEAGDMFYIIEEGECVVTQSRSIHEGVDSKPVTLMHLGPGQYFGEIALLKDQPRAANVIAVGRVKALCLNRRDFNLLMGPLNDILSRNIAVYTTYDEASAQAQASPRHGTESVDAPRSLGDFLSNEEEFLRTLSGIVRGYLIPLREASKRVLEGGDVHKIFGNAELLLKLSQKLVDSLRRGPTPTAASAQSILDFANALKLFESLVAGRFLAMHSLEENMEQKEFSAELERLQQEDDLAVHHDARDLKTLLSVAFDRPKVYPDWFRDLKRVTDDPEWTTALSSAETVASQTVARIDSSVADAKALFDVYRLLEPTEQSGDLSALTDTPLSSSPRRLTRRADIEFGVGPSAAPEAGFAFLFSDVALLCRPAEKDMFSVIKMLFRGDWEAARKGSEITIEHFTEDEEERVVLRVDETQAERWLADLDMCFKEE